MTDDPFLQRVLDEHDEFLREQAVSDRRLERLQKQVREKRAGGEVIRKRHDPPPQQRVADLSAEVQARWDHWCEEKIWAALAAYKEAETDAIARAISELRRECKAEIAKALGEFQRDFRLPPLRGWTPGFHREGSLVIAAGGLYQALRDTSHDPGHFDWQVVACPGHDGQDGRDLRDSYSVTSFRKHSNAT